jgi:hypothetical protein
VSILDYIENTISFVVLTFAYYSVIISLLTGFFCLVGLGLGLGVRYLMAGRWEKEAATYAPTIEVTGIMLLSLIVVLILIGSSIWQQPWFLFWTNPTALAIYLLSVVIAAALLRSDNPYSLQQGAASVISSGLVALFVILAPLFPARFYFNDARWAAITGASCVFLAGVYSATKLVKGIRTFAALNERRQKIGSHMSRLQHVGNVLPNTSERVKIQEALEHLEASYQKAEIALRQKNLNAAEEVILPAEVEVESLYREVDNRIRLSLKDELKAKLAQSMADLEALRREFEAAGLQGDEVKGLEARVKDLSGGLDTLVFDSARLLSQIEPFERLFVDIVTTRTALRFQSNVGASLDKLRQELRDDEAHIALAEALGLNTEVASRCRAKFFALLEEFTISSAEDLVRRYRALGEAASDHKSAINNLGLEIKRRFWEEHLEPLHTQVFVPKSVTTTHAATGAVLVRSQGSQQPDPLDCEIDGVLLEFPQSRTFSIIQSGNTPFTVRPFDIIGKRGGTGKLNVAVKIRGTDTSQPRPFKVSVANSAFETGRDVFALATPCGGVVGLAFWFLWRDVTIAGPLGAGTGGTIALLLFVFHRLRAKT